MGKKIDLTDQRFGRLIAREEVGRNKHGKVLWSCECDCGNIVIVKTLSLRNGDTQSCGCLRKEMASKINRIDLIDQKFTRLLVAERVRKGNKIKWKCQCDCGNVSFVDGDKLKSGHTKSCGCLSRELTSKRFYKHGLSSTFEYRSNYNKNNRPLKNVAKARYRAKQKNQTPDNANLQKIQLYYSICAYLNSNCEIPMWHVDHIRPISKGGLHHEDNLQILTAEINLQKSAKYPLTKEEEIKYKGIMI